MSDLPEIISSKEVYKAKVFTVFDATIQEGETVYRREIITHNGSAVILPVFADGKIALVRQYRHPAREFLLECPAGSLNPDENPQEGAARELEEEIGVTAERIEKLTEFYVSPGFLGEKMFLFLATDLHETAQNLESDEILNIVKLTFPEALEMIKTNQIQDAKTMVAILLAAPRFGF